MILLPRNHGLWLRFLAGLLFITAAPPTLATIAFTKRVRNNGNNYILLLHIHATTLLIQCIFRYMSAASSFYIRHSQLSIVYGPAEYIGTCFAFFSRAVADQASVCIPVFLMSILVTRWINLYGYVVTRRGVLLIAILTWFLTLPVYFSTILFHEVISESEVIPLEIAAELTNTTAYMYKRNYLSERLIPVYQLLSPLSLMLTIIAHYKMHERAHAYSHTISPGALKKIPQFANWMLFNTFLELASYVLQFFASGHAYIPFTVIVGWYMYIPLQLVHTIQAISLLYFVPCFISMLRRLFTRHENIIEFGEPPHQIDKSRRLSI